jgi:hypothetical protein
VGRLIHSLMVALAFSLATRATAVDAARSAVDR